MSLDAKAPRPFPSAVAIRAKRRPLRKLLAGVRYREGKRRRISEHVPQRAPHLGSVHRFILVAHVNRTTQIGIHPREAFLDYPIVIIRVIDVMCSFISVGIFVASRRFVAAGFFTGRVVAEDLVGVPRHFLQSSNVIQFDKERLFHESQTIGFSPHPPHCCWWWYHRSTLPRPAMLSPPR